MKGIPVLVFNFDKAFGCSEVMEDNKVIFQIRQLDHEYELSEEVDKKAWDKAIPLIQFDFNNPESIKRFITALANAVDMYDKEKNK